MITLREVIIEFVANGLGGPSKSRIPVKNLLIGKEKKKENKSKGKDAYVLVLREEISGCLDLPLDNPVVSISLSDAIKESVKAYSNSKATAIEAYKKLLNYILLKYKVELEVDFPRVFASDFDRQMFIVKELHVPKRGVDYLEDKLWVSTRTIEKDLAKLKSKGEISILDQEVYIDGIERENGSIGFESTVHPLFLAPNLTQVVVLLNGLQLMSKDESYRNYAEHLAATIWNELSEYGRKRIFTVSDTLSLDMTWYERINQIKDTQSFRTERECSKEEGSNNIVYFAKSGDYCNIAYMDERGEEQFLFDVKVGKTRTNEDIVEIIRNKERYLIKKSNIRRCTLDSKRLY